MFHSRMINNEINRLHERCLDLLYGKKSTSFEKLLEQDKSITLHTRNLQILATEMFKVYRNISPPIFKVVIIVIYESIHILQRKVCFPWK